MTPEERELRRALNARSGEPTPAFRARLSTALAEGRPAGDGRQAIALMAAILLAVGTVAVFLLLRHGPSLVPAQRPPTLLPPSTPSQAPVLSPSPAASAGPAVTASPTILASPIPLPTIAEFDAPSSSVVWAFVGGLELFRSTDRGETWQQRPLPSDPGPKAGVSFVDDAQGWLLSRGSSATQCQAEVATIWHTIDTGATWQRMDTQGIADAQCKSGLSFVDPTHGFLVASDPNHPPVIYRTADGGRTWAASRPLTDPPGFTSQPVGFTLTAGRMRSFGSTLLVPVGSYVFRSTDGGASWSYLASAPNHTGSIAFVTATRWLSLIVPGQSEETLDAGATWHAYASDYDQAAPVAPDVVFSDSAVGYATMRGGLQRTLDGGLHWSSLHTPGT
jgi:photosystem II stability/assembly factor-like uncharacterized protein